MASTSRLALGTLLALGTASIVATAPASAKSYSGPVLSKSERAALSALETALNARNYPAANAALAPAQAAAQSADARFYLAGLQLRLGRETANTALQASAIDALVASGRVPAAEQGALYATQGALATFAGKRDRAEAALTRAYELSPTAETALALAQLKLDRRKNAEALPLIDRAISLRKAAGQPVPESWYRRGVNVATIANATPEVLKFSRELVAAYPSEKNWRDTILLYRDFAKPDQAATLDAERLLRLSRALAGERDYLEAAQAFESANLSGEAQSVFQEGVAAKMVDPAKASFKEAIATSTKRAGAAKAKLAGLRTAAASAATGTAALTAGDQHLSFGDYAAAAELYRAALTKSGVDTATANTRLGIALALAGRRAEADAAFRAVTGPRADLASLWLVWLGQRA
ncbi:hypothetical protein E2493_00935 [Sphingomonas parva]|uniref:Tetratricopeptide repeat protein n=1 Tax=Sphingomonas parva TaxID=2555898 RepID=A0A4Y8ZZM5_9SPHN|nr:hypothetical protein [Sphingomonas parva]TFI60306.1 hypothetical protein E2493_00935 [Sphingomonas parva]